MKNSQLNLLNAASILGRKGGLSTSPAKQKSSQENGKLGGRPLNLSLNEDGVSVKGCSLIYAPKGQAGEYAPLACNPYHGCGHKCTYCLSPDTLIHMADGTTRYLSEIQTGDEVVGILKRQEVRRAWNWTFTPSRVTNKVWTHKPAFRIRLSNGMSAICSEDHRWLTERGWKFTRRLTLNNKVRVFAAPILTPKISDLYCRGYLAGIIRGDGSLHRYDYSDKYQHQFRLAMNDTEAIDRAMTFLGRFDVKVTRFDFQNGSGGTMPAIRANSRFAFTTIVGLMVRVDDDEWMRGWLAGIFDAEGGTTKALRIHNTHYEILEQVESAMKRFDFKTIRDKEHENGCVSIRLLGGLPEITRFFSFTSPAIRRKFPIDGAALRGSSQIIEINPLGRIMDMVDITTSTQNFIANGMISHNCYVPAVLRISRAEFDAGAIPRKNFLESLQKDARKYQAMGIKDQIMLSFTTDPYHPGDTLLTRQVIELLRNHRMSFCTLTKGGSRALRDLDLFRPNLDAFATTLTSLDDSFSRKWEPDAALPADRIETLKRFHAAGIFTWVSLEPTLSIESSLKIMGRTHNFVDLYKIGRANYIPTTKIIDWKDYTHRMVEMVSLFKVKHYFKKDLQGFLPPGYKNLLRITQHH